MAAQVLPCKPIPPANPATQGVSLDKASPISFATELKALTEEELTYLQIMADWFGHNRKERMDAIEIIKNRESPALRSLAVAIADSNMQGLFLKMSCPLWDCYTRYYRWRYDCSIWKEKRDKIIKERRKCERCGSTKDLHVHHIKGLRSEMPEDLELLCRKCHKKIPF